MTLREIIEQLESCNYECEAGNLENNVAWQELKVRTVFLEIVMGNQDRLNYEYIANYLWNGKQNDTKRNI